MFCTACQSDVLDRSHYNTEIHTTNARRKIMAIPPLRELPQPASIPQVEEKPIKHHPIRIIKSTNECFFCNETHQMTLYDHVNTHLTQAISPEVFDILKAKFDCCECIFCSRYFSDKQRLKIHHLQHTNNKSDQKSAFLNDGTKIVKKQFFFEHTQIRRPVEPVHDRIVKVEVIKKQSVEKSKKVKNDIKISFMLNHQKFFTEHWRQ